MTHLGISVYPDLRPLDEIEEYFKLAGRYGVTRCFSSMFSVEGTKEEVLDYFRKLIEAAHRYGIQVSLDVNPECFAKMGATAEDLSVFRSIDVDILRMDLSFGLEKDMALINNPYGIGIELNAAIIDPQPLVDAGVDPKKISLCHNFFPQQYTGMRFDKFMEINRKLKAASRDISVGAFISSNASDTHGVWGAVKGLPTVERMRNLPIDLQARLMLATSDVDDVLIGNAYASEEELKALSEILTARDMQKEAENNPFLKMFLSYGIIDEKTTSSVKIRVEEESGISEDERGLLYDFFPHYMGDGSEWMMHSRMSRGIYSQPDHPILPRKYSADHFSRGDVLVVNDSYKHYCGEVQIALDDIDNDGIRNCIGHITGDELQLLDVISTPCIIEFLKK